MFRRSVVKHIELYTPLCIVVVVAVVVSPVGWWRSLVGRRETIGVGGQTAYPAEQRLAQAVEALEQFDSDDVEVARRRRPLLRTTSRRAAGDRGSERWMDPRPTPVSVRIGVRRRGRQTPPDPVDERPRRWFREGEGAVRRGRDAASRPRDDDDDAAHPDRAIAVRPLRVMLVRSRARARTADGGRRRARLAARRTTAPASATRTRRWRARRRSSAGRLVTVTS